MLLAISDPVWNALIAAVLAIVLKWMDYRSEQRSKKVSDEVQQTKSELKGVSDNVQKIETATNSMKDQLVLATKEAANLQGRADERAEQQSGPVATPMATPTAKPTDALVRDVKEIKRDVKEVKAEVIKGE